jgi:hypothetical protein
MSFAFITRDLQKSPPYSEVAISNKIISLQMGGGIWTAIYTIEITAVDSAQVP